LSCFEAAARHQSFTRAAQELALTQGAVSRQVAALEEFVGMALFKRSQHGMALTPAGQDYARKIQQRLEGLERDTIDLMAHQGLGDAVKLATMPTFATRWLIPRLPLLNKEQPELIVHLETSTRPFMFANTGFDAALYAGTPEQVQQWAGTRADFLLQEDVLPVCSPALLPNGQITPEELARLPLLQQTTRIEGWRQWFNAYNVDAPFAMRGPRYELFSMTSVAAMHG
jgi:DNA-binding transcriptional LysR family regulator